MARNEKAINVTSSIVDSRRARSTAEAGWVSSSGSRTKKWAEMASSRSAVPRRGPRSAGFGAVHSIQLVRASRRAPARQVASVHQRDLRKPRAKSSAIRPPEPASTLADRLWEPPPRSSPQGHQVDRCGMQPTRGGQRYQPAGSAINPGEQQQNQRRGGLRYQRNHVHGMKLQHGKEPRNAGGFAHSSTTGGNLLPAGGSHLLGMPWAPPAVRAVSAKSCCPALA